MIRLLLVDNEFIALVMTKTFPGKDNAIIECDTANSAQEALLKLAASSHDAIVPDYTLSKMDGDTLNPVAIKDLVAVLKGNRARATRNRVPG